jgi:8-oxo-dGTP pyrophosphatase MutT (NUDIX family)
MSTAKPATVVPKRLFVAVPVLGLADVLIDGISACVLSRTKVEARRRQGGRRKDCAIVRVRSRDATREGFELRERDGGWEPVGTLEPHLLECRDERALRAVKAHRKTSAGGLLVSSLEDPRVLLMYRVHGEKDAWKTPKGGIARGESRRKAARREVAEESGLRRVKIVGSLGSMQYFKREDGRLREKTVHLFLMLHKDGETEISPREGERYVRGEWLRYDEAIARVTQKQARSLIARAERLLTKRNSGREAPSSTPESERARPLHKR